MPDEQFIIFSLPLIVGCALDFIFGDPPSVPHPVRFFGTLISRGESALNSGEARFVKGAFLAVVLSGGTYLFFLVLEGAVATLGLFAEIVFASIFVFFGLAGASLVSECGAVFSEIENRNICAARKNLSRTVGRDTAGLDGAQMKTAALETMSENLSDGVAAPIFFYALGGIPAMMAYKMASTLDSMLGYKNDKYRDFGAFSARLDDAANFIPARLTAFLMAALARKRSGFRFIFKFGRAHPSPNAGLPQAALAGILDCRFGGVCSYGGRVVRKPFIGENLREIKRRDYETAKKINNAVMISAVALAIFFRFFI